MRHLQHHGDNHRANHNVNHNVNHSDSHNKRPKLVKSVFSMGCFLSFGAIIIFTGLNTQDTQSILTGANSSLGVWSSPTDYSGDYSGDYSTNDSLDSMGSSDGASETDSLDTDPS